MHPGNRSELCVFSWAGLQWLQRCQACAPWFHNFGTCSIALKLEFSLGELELSLSLPHTWEESLPLSFHTGLVFKSELSPWPGRKHGSFLLVGTVLVLPPSGDDRAVPGSGCFACFDLTADTTGEAYRQKGPKWECILQQSLCSHCWTGSSLILPRFSWDTRVGRAWLDECSVQPVLQQCQPPGFSSREYESQKRSLCATPVRPCPP